MPSQEGEQNGLMGRVDEGVDEFFSRKVSKMNKSVLYFFFFSFFFKAQNLVMVSQQTVFNGNLLDIFEV